MSATQIGDLFVAKGLVNEEQISHALAVQVRTGQRLGEVLVELGLISRMDLASALQVQWKSIDADSAPISTAEVAEARSYRTTEENLRAQLAERDARIAELSKTVEELGAAVTDRDERLAVLLTFLQAPAAR